MLDRDFGVAVRAGALAAGRGSGVSIAVSTRSARGAPLRTGAAASPDSVFHIASVGKVFTGLTLAHMIEEGIVRLDDRPVRELIPGAGLARPAR